VFKTCLCTVRLIADFCSITSYVGFILDGLVVMLDVIFGARTPKSHTTYAWEPGEGSGATFERRNKAVRSTAEVSSIYISLLLESSGENLRAKSLPRLA